MIEIGEFPNGKCCVIEEIKTQNLHTLRRATTNSKDEAESIKLSWTLRDYQKPGLYQVLK